MSVDTPHMIEILNAPDMVETVLAEEAITEPVGAARGLKRPTLVKYESVSVGYRLTQANAYRDGPDSKGWGAMVSNDYTEEAL